MKPVAVFRHMSTEGPGYFATFLQARSVPWTLIRVDSDDPIPADPAAYSGLVFMGGYMSVNDDLPWIPQSLALIRAAVERDIPVLGHCLGGQLMAKALGGEVTRNPVKEIGWGEVTVADTPVARRWFGDTTRFDAFHWHGETFSLPAGAELILSSPHCRNQAFALGKHVGMQCHVEMTEDMVREWCAVGTAEIDAARHSPAVQVPEAICADLPRRIATLNGHSAALYGRWIDGLVR